MCSRRNSMCRGPVAAKYRECYRNAKQDSVCRARKQGILMRLVSRQRPVWASLGEALGQLIKSVILVLRGLRIGWTSVTNEQGRHI